VFLAQSSRIVKAVVFMATAAGSYPWPRTQANTRLRLAAAGFVLYSTLSSLGGVAGLSARIRAGRSWRIARVFDYCPVLINAV